MANDVDIIRRIYEGFDRGDLAPLLESLDPDVEWNEAEHITRMTRETETGSEQVEAELLPRRWEERHRADDW